MDKEKSGRMAHHGHTGEEKEQEESGEVGNDSGDINSSELSSSRNNSDTQVGDSDERRNEASGVVVDPEKGRDITIVTWFSENDPEVNVINIFGSTLFLIVCRIH